MNARKVSVARLLPYLEDTDLRGLIGPALDGLRTAFPETGPAIEAVTNDAGKQLIADTAHECSAEVALRHGLRSTTAYTASGRPLAEEAVADPVIRRALDHLRLGTRTPSAPVLIATGGNDDIVDPAQVRQLATDWCARGATVDLIESPVPTFLPGTSAGHIVNSPVAGLGTAYGWLRDRFAGLPAPRTCG